MTHVVEYLDRFDGAAPVRVLQRDETQMYAKAVAGPFGEVATATELVEVIHIDPAYTPGEFGPPKVLFAAPRARIEWQQMDNRQPHFHRNLDVDEMSYQISGERTLMSEHGTVELRPGDFVRLPVGVCHDNWGREESHILWYTPDGMEEQQPADRFGQVLVPPFEGWVAAVVNEALTDCLGAPEHVIVAQRADERLILEDALTHEDRLAVVRFDEEGQHDGEQLRLLVGSGVTTSLVWEWWTMVRRRAWSTSDTVTRTRFSTRCPGTAYSLPSMVSYSLNLETSSGSQLALRSRP